MRGKLHKPTDESRRNVRGLAGLGMTVDDISRLVGITENTLRKHYPNEMAKGRAEANVRVSEALFKAATRANPNVMAQMFWLKNRAGWKDLAVNAGEEGASSLRVEFVRASPALEAKTIDAVKVTNGHDAPEEHRTFDVAFE